MKFATPMGACAGNNVQVILPAVVSMTAMGWPETAEGAVAGLGGVVVVFVWDQTETANKAMMTDSPILCRIRTPL
jgi:hypothetical protein